MNVPPGVKFRGARSITALTWTQVRSEEKNMAPFLFSNDMHVFLHKVKSHLTFILLCRSLG